MSIKLYCDLMSQPSRTLYILLKTIKCDFETKLVDLRKGQHFSDEFTKINKIQRVPVIEHNGFILSESVAIVNYLSREGIIPDNLYPQDSKKRARVEEFLEWHHIGLRLPCSMYFRVKQLDPIITGKQPEAKTVAGYENRMLQSLDTFSTKWLNQGHDFLCGNTVTVADLFAACELEQPRMAGYDPKEHFPAIATWAKKVQQHFNPYYDEGHVIVNKVINKQKKMSSKI
uniref:Glutathione S-transferase theta 1 n=1 Tax=Chilo suppressalis TaxID=168631 RepID=A0A0K0XRS0_CHISP|nr:glutathione S-transferase theta 1 [Chilo suppressalis]